MQFPSSPSSRPDSPQPSWWKRLRLWFSGSSRQQPLPAAAVIPTVVPVANQPRHLPKTQMLGRSGTVPPPYPKGSLIDNRYLVLGVFPQADSTCYEATDRTGQGYRYLLRESAGHLPTDLTTWPQLPGLCVPVENLIDHGRTATVVAAPELPWKLLTQIQVPVDLTEAVGWSLQIGHVLRQLVDVWGPPPPWKEFMQAIVIGRQAKLIDLHVLGSVMAEGHRPEQHAIASMLHHLRFAHLPNDSDARDKAARTVMHQGLEGRYPTLKDMLEALHYAMRPPVLPIYPAAALAQRSGVLRQSAGAGTDVGRLREHNEDSIAKFDYMIDQTGEAHQVGLYIVADGMGGYEGGEIASRQTAEQAFRSFIEKQFMPVLKKETGKLGIPGTGSPQARLLTQLVQEANAIVYRNNQIGRTEHGTTITAALIIGNRLAVANVGDSRTYLFHNDHLEQITHDHSLVYRLYQTGQITRDEIYTHEKKNLVFRSLGDKPTVEADIYERTLQRGSRLLLCSDGLWEMVRDDAISTILRTVPDPFGACDRLIEAANAGGGEDNISAIVVDMV